MTWTSPLTAVTNAPLTAAQWNASVRDNLLETAPAKAATEGGYFAVTGVNSIAERNIAHDIVETSETSTSTSYTNLATNGPVATVVSGTRAMIWLNTMEANSSTGAGVWCSFEVYGATTSAAIDGRGIYLQNNANYDFRAGVCNFFATLTPGTNTFRMQYKVSSGTGTWRNRRLQVMPL